MRWVLLKAFVSGSRFVFPSHELSVFPVRGCGSQAGIAFTDVEGEFYAACSTTNSLYRLRINFGREPFMAAYSPVASGSESSEQHALRVRRCLDAHEARKTAASEWLNGML